MHLWQAPAMNPGVADLSRYDDVLAWLRRTAAADPDVLTVWVGGSAATGGYDEWSDLDIDMLVTAGTHHDVCTRLLGAVRAELVVDHVWEVPRELWPDGAQFFAMLQRRPGLLEEPTRIIDLHLSSISEEHQHLDVRRHGTPIVVHDPAGLLTLRHDDEGAMARARAVAEEQVRQRRALGQWLVNRAIARGHGAEAVATYLRFALEPLVRMLRHEHCPWRHDYGLRYLDTDLPADVTERVESLVPGWGPGPLRAQSDAAYAWLDELLGS